MFIKRTRGGSPNKPIYYLQLTQSYRDEQGITRHRVLTTLGREDELVNNGSMDALATNISRYCKDLLIINQKKDVPINTYILGPILAFEGIWKELKLEGLMEEVKSRYEIDYDLNKAVKLMVLNRLVKPKSKLGITEWVSRLYGGEYKGVELQHLYRALDVLSINSQKIQDGLYERTISLFKPEVKIVFYDLTTLYFESQKEDDIKKYGYSKDNKTDSVQVILGLIVDKEGLPLGYEVYPGNTFEGKTVKEAIKKLKEEYEIKKVIIVGDKGIMNEAVMEELEKVGYEYILAAKLKGLSKKYHEDILDISKYEEVNEDIKGREIKIGNRRLILGYSEKRANRDKKMREKVIEKLMREGTSKVYNQAYSKYVRIEDKKAELNMEAVKESERWDGYFGFYTNNEEMSREEIVKAYRELNKIEESFRCMKGTLELRPMYHWTEKKIKGHINMCYISFYVYRVMQKKLKEKEVDISIEDVMEELSEIRAIEIKQGEEKYVLRSEITSVRNEILRALGVKIPTFVLKGL